MRVRRITLHPLRSAFTGGGYRTSYGNRTHLDNLILRLETDDGAVGHGEICKITGGSPEPGAPDRLDRAKARFQGVIGAKATPVALADALGSVTADDHNLACALDVAGWDILSQSAGVPIHDLLGGAMVPDIPIYFTLGQTDPRTTAASVRDKHADGYRVFQIKVGTDPHVDRERVETVLSVLPDDATVLFDANGGWSIDDAVEIIRAFDSPSVLWEEPCKGYEDNRVVAERTGARLMLDQCMASLTEYARLSNDRFAAATGLKPTIQKGLSKARAARDLCVEAGIALKIDDSWGVDIATVVSLSIAVGVPRELLVCGADMRLNFEGPDAQGGPVASRGTLTPSGAPGLGLDLVLEPAVTTIE